MTDETRREAAGTSTPGLVGDALSHVTSLVRGEMDLARAEIQENVNKAVAAIGMIVGALVLLLVALNVLAAALVAWLTETGLDAGWASLIVGGALALIAAIMAVSGKNKLKLASLAPTRTAKNARCSYGKGGRDPWQINPAEKSSANLNRSVANSATRSTRSSIA